MPPSLTSSVRFWRKKLLCHVITMAVAIVKKNAMQSWAGILTSDYLEASGIGGAAGSSRAKEISQLWMYD